jgi:hypothetical protein
MRTSAARVAVELDEGARMHDGVAKLCYDNRLIPFLGEHRCSHSVFTAGVGSSDRLGR